RMNSSFEKLSSGSRINSARDDSAGLQIADRLTTQITGLNQANRNANDGISIAQIAEGALSEVTTNVQRMRQLVVQGGNRTMSSDDRSALAQEFTKLLDTNNDIAERTAYGTTKILNGDSPQSGFQIQSGAQAGQQDTVTTGNAELSALFGKIAAGESATGNMSAISGMNNAALKALGTAGELVVAYLAVEGTTKATRGEALEEVANALFGTDREGAVADFGTDKGEGTINTAALTKILEGNIDSPYDGTTTSTAFNVIMDGATGLLANAGVDLEGSVGFTDAQINTLHGFATDTLLDAMSGLVTQVDTQRAKLGAEQNGLTSIVRSNTAAVVNVSDSRSRIMDTDFASETSELTRNQIIQQASTTILSQANQLPQTALSLLR
ncbi:flagellin, partial [Oceanospirillum maris]|uniref:flagellin N-terminal helical domain-containing protein n=1 Tax=Oceanospirillum maris TaxID=64977 RepID=UPI000A032655